ncbi:MAG: mechanosensitive ion channel family protein [Planctomycetota bacterium]
MHAFRLALALICLLLGGRLALAQSEGEAPPPPAATPVEATPVDPGLASAEASMRTFLEAMDEVALARDGTARNAALDRALSAFAFPATMPRDSRVRIANQMKGVLDRIKEVDYDGDFLSAWHSAGDRFVYFPQRKISEHRKVAPMAGGLQIAIARGDDAEWRFDASTVESNDELFRRLEHLPIAFGSGELALTPAMWLRSQVPPGLRDAALLGVEHWQWIGLLSLILIGLALDLIVRAFLSGVWHGIERRRGETSDRELLKKTVRPFGQFAAAVAWYWGLRVLGLPPLPEQVLTVAVRVILALSSLWAAYRLTDLISDFLARQADRTDTKFDDLLVPLLRKTVKVFITAVALVYIADAFEVEILPLLTGLGIGGLAVGFAAKDTIENFFGSIAVILDRPFEVGDWVAVDDVEGTVEQLGFRSTRVRTFYNSLVTIPNGTLVRARVDNYGRRRFRRFKTHLNLTYDTPPAKIEAFCEGIREIIRLHPYTRKDSYHVWLNQFGAHSLDVLVYMFHECPDWAIELRERHRFMLDVVRLADRLGVEFAFPTQTLHMYKEEHGRAHAPADTPASTEELDAQREGIETARHLTRNQPWLNESKKPGPVLFTGRDPEAREHRGESGE